VAARDRENAVEYPRFERLVIGSVALLVILTLAASSLNGGVDVAELIGQLAVIVIAAVAVHWGRKAGTIAALSACLLYLAMRLPMLGAGISSASFLLVLTRFAGYCLIGIVGGEIFGRVKYVLPAPGGSDSIDEWSGVYNQRHIAVAVEQAVERHMRYHETFSIIIISVAPSMTAPLRPEKLRSVIRTIARFLRHDVRMIDDVARIHDGRFVVLLPHTPGAAAPLVADRLAAGLCQALDAKSDCITTTCLAAAKDAVAIQEFLASVSPTVDEPVRLADVQGVQVGFDQNPES